MRIFTLFPNKSACIYDNKHAFQKISWIDEFQNEKDIQLSLINIMPFRYRAALLHWISSARSINSLVWVRAWVTWMTCFACQESCFFLAKFPLSSDLMIPNIRMSSNALNNLESRNPPPHYTNPSLHMQEVTFCLFKKSKSSVTGKRKST